jgi:hypothetical protein
MNQKVPALRPRTPGAAADISGMQVGKQGDDTLRGRRPAGNCAGSQSSLSHHDREAKPDSTLWLAQRLAQTQRQPQTRRPLLHQQRQTRRRGRRRQPGPTQTCVFSTQSSRAPGMRSSSGIALAVLGGPASPVATTAAPNKMPRVKARRSICFIERFLRRVARTTHAPFRAAPTRS